MIHQRLKLLPLDVLEKLAHEEGIKTDSEMEKDDLIELIVEALEEDRVEQELVNNASMKLKERKYKILEDQELRSQIDEDYPLVDEYNENRIVVLLRDPSWAYAYWDVKKSEQDNLVDSRPEGRLFLRVYEMTDGSPLNSNLADFFDIPLELSDRSWYINLPQTGVRYCIDLIALYRSGEKTLARSNVVYSPDTSVEYRPEDALFFDSNIDAFERFKKEKQIPQRIISVQDSQYIN